MKRVAVEQDASLSLASPSSVFNSSQVRGCVFGSGSHSEPRAAPSQGDYSVDSDTLMAKEIAQLSLTERNAIQEEIHGVHSNTEESPEKLEECLKQMQSELNVIRRKSAYDRALCLNPRYVQCRERRISFLRAERLDPALAARRYVKYFESKLEIWGMDKLGKEMTWDDLEEEDRNAVNSGYFWFTKDFDRAGRLIVWIRNQTGGYSSVSQTRNIWYQLMTALKDERVQKNGFVKIVYNVDSVPNLDPEMARKATNIFESMPFKLAALHFCYDKMVLRPFMTTILHMIGRSGRVRFRAHYGSHLECVYALITFGIPRSAIRMIQSSGNISPDKQVFYTQLEELRRNEAAEKEVREQATAGEIHCPAANDVLLGRGRPYQEFVGNLQLALLIDEYREVYFTSGRSVKAVISQHVVDLVKERNGRFLKKAAPDDSSWEVVDDEVARNKVSHGFRTKTKRSAGPMTQVRIPKQGEGLVLPAEQPQQKQPTTQASLLGEEVPLPTPMMAKNGMDASMIGNILSQFNPFPSPTTTVPSFNHVMVPLETQEQTHKKRLRVSSGALEEM